MFTVELQCLRTGEQMCATISQSNIPQILARILFNHHCIYFWSMTLYILYMYILPCVCLKSPTPTYLVTLEVRSLQRRNATIVPIKPITNFLVRMSSYILAITFYNGLNMLVQVHVHVHTCIGRFSVSTFLWGYQ